MVAHRAELAEEIGRNAVEQGRRAVGEELVTVLAHDLRNLLAPLGTRLEVLRMRAQRDGRADDVREVEAARRSVARLGGLVSDILDVARLDQGVFQLEPEPLDFGALVQETVSLLATAEHPVLMRVQDGGPIFLMADAGRLRQCLENIVANAVQKSPANAAVTVFVTREERRVRVDVVDQGPGIPADLLPHVFERFMSGKRRDGGLGLGLYLAKRIAAVHGGDLTVESPPGKGARFSLTLPLPAESGAARRAVPAAFPPG
jgi:signal transduction histidine kinase